MTGPEEEHIPAPSVSPKSHSTCPESCSVTGKQDSTSNSGASSLHVGPVVDESSNPII